MFKMFQTQENRKFVLIALIIAIVSGFLAWVLNISVLSQHYFVGVYLCIPFIMLVTIAIHLFLTKVSKNEPKKFINRFMATSGIKLFLYLIVIAVYTLSVNRDNILFVIAFFFLYVIYTITEISVILNYLKKN